MARIADRERYESDGGIRTTMIPLGVVAAVGPSLIVAWLLKTLFMNGWYLILFVPGLCALLIGGVLHGAVSITHCRNRWFAGLTGVLAGIGAYLGYFYLCLAQPFPPGVWPSLGLLPQYIVFRMQTDIAEDVAKPDDQGPQKKPVTGLNWYMFVCELGVLVGLPAGIAWQRAKRAYSPELRQWMRRETAMLQPRTAAMILDAFDAGQLQAYISQASPTNNSQMSCRLSLEYSPPCTDSPLSYPIYASVEDVPVPKPWYWPATQRKTYLRQAKLTTDEVLVLRHLFPLLAAELASHSPEIVRSASISSGHSVMPAQNAAVVMPVTDPYRQQVRSKGYALKVNLIGLIPLVLFAGGAGLVALGGYLIHRGQVGLSVLPILFGAPTALAGVYTALGCLCVFENRWIERRLRAEIARRPDSLLDPTDVRNRYVSLIPRDSFVQVKLTMSSDVLLMSIDPRRRAIILEGDSDRYYIPVHSIIECGAQCFFHPMDAHQRTEMWMVRLLAQFEMDVRELLISVSQTNWKMQSNKTRQAIAEQTCRQIDELRAV